MRQRLGPGYPTVRAAVAASVGSPRRGEPPSPGPRAHRRRGVSRRSAAIAAWLRGDVIAGLTVWAVLVPESLAYASIAGVSPVVGLYAAPPALVLYALFGSSRHLVVGPMSATAALSAAAVADFATQGQPAYVTLTAALAIVTGHRRARRRACCGSASSPASSPSRCSRASSSASR